ncbi:DUF4249 domain-containing protein [Chryseolinea soli]|uniref:DUF4249 domain-containing protein n=1 Tax=Chryseolinea soli TaxID=2321403 RepID=A0A385SH80_9BACT|nr:DUF4249 domain-containing protein [Chryseolinea soli]AYB29786.1 DUF4249 domain-containing protein [Chryseolinea soli]
MTFTKKHSLLYALAAFLFSSCLDPYSPPATTDNVDLLVVDGFLSVTSSSVSVRLSHAVALDDSSVPPAEQNANVRLEESDGGSVTLSGDTDGNYTATGLTIDASKKYRVHIQTHSGKEYFSDYVDVLKTPDIDSVTWRPSDKDVTLYANTHDDTGKSKYYLWNYVETYEYSAPYPAGYEMRNGEPTYIPSEERVDICWKTNPSTTILVTSSERLSVDLIRDFPLVVIPAGSSKISRRYSLLVTQRTISKEAYTFWAQLQKTTESLGGLFDPMPSEVVGNVHSATNANEAVLGFFSAGEEKQQRIFIKNRDLPDNIRRMPLPFCPLDSIEMSVVKTLSDHTFLVYPYGVPVTLGYVSSTIDCMDCRVKGGVTQKPDFW